MRRTPISEDISQPIRFHLYSSTRACAWPAIAPLEALSTHCSDKALLNQDLALLPPHPHMPSRIAWRKDDAGRFRLHVGWVAARYMQAPTKVRPSIRGVLSDHVGARHADPDAVDEQPHYGLAVNDSLDKVGGRSAIPIVTARKPVAVLVASIIHTPIAYVRGHCCGIQHHAETKPPTLHCRTSPVRCVTCHMATILARQLGGYMWNRRAASTRC